MNFHQQFKLLCEFDFSFHSFLCFLWTGKSQFQKFIISCKSLLYVVVCRFRISYSRWASYKGLPIGCFQYRPKDGAKSVLLHKNSNKNSNILLHKPLSAPSFGRYWKQPIRKPYYFKSYIVYMQSVTKIQIYLFLKYFLNI